MPSDRLEWEMAEMAQDLNIRVNEQNWRVSATPDTPLLYV
jgi:hypothetical protein